MSTRIQVLPAHLIDQIAAGEVVERPASVVKELVENALDASASRIVVRVEEGGRALVRVTDDGEGMGRDDLALAVVRHATSKIREPDDLQRIGSLGFRGEALPSIAAVSKLRIVTRRRDDEAGSLLVMEGAGQPVISDVGAAAGTDITVRELFFNTPARRKFLRTPATEMSHIGAWITHLGLARPGVHLRLEHNGRKVLDAPGNEDLSQRVAALLGREAFEHLHPVEHEEPGLHLDGLVSAPAYSRPNTRGIHLFVNGRFVRDRLLQYAVMEGYRTVLPGGRFPLVVLRLEFQPGLVDVNVHPQKIEVRFADVRGVQRALSAAIAGVLSRSPWVDFGGQAPSALAETPARSYRLSSGPARTARSYAARGRMEVSRDETRPAARIPASPAGPPLADWQVAGVLWNTYVALISGDRLVFVDQHAAHERIVFERLRASVDGDGVRSQRLLVPVQIELEAALTAVAGSGGEALAEMGFEIEPFGPGVVSVKAVPALLADAPVVELVRDVLDEMAETEQAGVQSQRRLTVLSRMACHGSVRAGQALTEPEIRSLLEQLEGIDFGGLCPHGRPVLVDLSRVEVERWFHRS